MEVTLGKTIYHPPQQMSRYADPDPGGVVDLYKNATGGTFIDNLANIIGPGGVQAKITVDVPDSVVYKVFGAVALGVGVGMTVGALFGGLIKRRLTK